MVPIQLMSSSRSSRYYGQLLYKSSSSLSSSSSSSATQALERELLRNDLTIMNRRGSGDMSVAQVSNRLCSFHFDSSAAAATATPGAATSRAAGTTSVARMIEWDDALSTQSADEASSFVSESSMDSWDTFLADFDEVTPIGSTSSSSSNKTTMDNGSSRKRGRNDDDDIVSSLTHTDVTPSPHRGRMVRCKKIKSNLASLIA